MNMRMVDLCGIYLPIKQSEGKESTKRMRMVDLCGIYLPMTQSMGKEYPKRQKKSLGMLHNLGGFNDQRMTKQCPKEYSRGYPQRRSYRPKTYLRPFRPALFRNQQALPRCMENYLCPRPKKGGSLKKKKK